jgi:hypothetical protein
MYATYNMHKRISKSKVLNFIKDELKGMTEYRRLGFKSQSKDEKKHAKFFKRLSRKMKKKRK